MADGIPQFEPLQDPSSSVLNPTTYKGLRILNKLAEDLKSAAQPQIFAPWLRQIDRIVAKSGNTRVIIGVVGATGSGKSSVINALLGEKQLIPTNCMRACTAVVTEISYNDQPGHPWRAIIEFISPEAWRKELELLLNDVDTAAGSITDEESEAGIAFSKITAVYPALNKKNISKAEVDTLMQKEEITNYLGTSIEVQATTGQLLHTQIQRYVDSKEKIGTQCAEIGGSSTREMDDIEYWPLISRVCIYGKSAVLRTGCVLVDLPGVADSNSARAAVAKSYLKNCATLWVMAPIIRAVDDKTARHLLGDGFKRQLHRDGTLSRITFVCTKTDEIVIHEARHELNRAQDFLKGMKDIDLAKAQVTKDLDAVTQALVQAKKDLQRTSECHAKTFKEEQAYRQLKNLAVSTRSVVHPPLLTESPRKRRSDDSGAPATPKKRTKIADYMFRASQASSGNNDTRASTIETTSTAATIVQPVVQDMSKPSMTHAAVVAKILELAQARLAIKSERDGALARKDKFANELDELKQIETEILAHEWSACVQGRNKYTSTYIQADFTAGLQDLARDNAQDDDTNFDPAQEPEADLLTASSLPVFCVSSQGYQKLLGHLEGEQVAARFSNFADTGVPSLEQHACKIGTEQMVADEEAFLNDTERLLTSLRLWSAGTNEVADPCSEENNAANVESAIDELVQALKDIVQMTCTSMQGVVKSRIFQVLPAASDAAQDRAMITVEKWGKSPKDPVEPGLYYSTFKAVCRRDGAYTNPRKAYNFGADLLDPFMQKIDAQWNSVFDAALKSRFIRAVKQCAEKLKTFVETFQSSLEAGCASENTKATFEEQQVRFAKSLGRTLKLAKKEIDKEQKEANRLFEECIEAAMKSVYRACTQESGAGCYARMKEIMRQHVEEHKDAMFMQAADRVRTELEAMLSERETTVVREVDELCDGFRQDCMNLVSSQSREFTKLADACQKDVLAAINQADVAVCSLTKSEDSNLDPALQLAVTPDDTVAMATREMSRLETPLGMSEEQMMYFEEEMEPLEDNFSE